MNDNAMRKIAGGSGPQRGGRVKAPGKARPAAVSERPGRTGTVLPPLPAFEMPLKRANQGGTAQHVASPLTDNGGGAFLFNKTNAF
jgi:hypothetical protein